MSAAPRVTMTRSRFMDLADAARQSPCFCAIPEQRRHDGICISCWALREHIGHVRSTAPRSGTDEYATQWIARLEGEQNLRARQLPETVARYQAFLAETEKR